MVAVAGLVLSILVHPHNGIGNPKQGATTLINTVNTITILTNTITNDVLPLLLPLLLYMFILLLYLLDFLNKSRSSLGSVNRALLEVISSRAQLALHCLWPTRIYFDEFTALGNSSSHH